MADITRTLSFTVLDPFDQTPIEGAKIKIKLTKSDYTSEGTVLRSDVSILTDENGQATVSLIPNVLGTQRSQYSIKITQGGRKLVDEVVTMPDQDSVLSDLVDAEEPITLTDAQITLAAAQEQANVATAQATIATNSATAAAASETAAEGYRDQAAVSASEVEANRLTVVSARDQTQTYAAEALVSRNEAEGFSTSASNSASSAASYAATALLAASVYLHTDGIANATPIIASNFAEDGTIEMIQVDTSDRVVVGDATADMIVKGGSITIEGDVTITGDLQTTTANEVNIGDAVIVLNANETGSPTMNAGFEIERGTDTNVSLLWNETLDRWEIDQAFYSSDTITASFVGSIDGVLGGNTPAAASVTTMAASGNATVGGTLEVTGVATFDNKVTVNTSGGSLVATPSTFYDDLVIQNTTSETGSGITILANATDGFGGVKFGDSSGSNQFGIGFDSSANRGFIDVAGSEAIGIDASKNVGIGVPDGTGGASYGQLAVKGAANTVYGSWDNTTAGFGYQTVLAQGTVVGYLGQGSSVATGVADGFSIRSEGDLELWAGGGNLAVTFDTNTRNATFTGNIIPNGGSALAGSIWASGANVIHQSKSGGFWVLNKHDNSVSLLQVENDTGTVTFAGNAVNVSDDSALDTDANYPALNFRTGSVQAYNVSDQAYINLNAGVQVGASGAWRYTQSATTVSRIELNGDTLSYFGASAGTAGNPVTWSTYARISSSEVQWNVNRSTVVPHRFYYATDRWDMYHHSDNTFRWNFNGAGNDEMILTSAGALSTTTGSLGTISERRFKENITPATSQWEDVKTLATLMKNYNLKEGDGKKLLGWIVDEIEEDFSGLVFERTQGLDIVKGVNLSAITYKGVGALGEALVRIEELESEVSLLKSEVAELRAA